MTVNKPLPYELWEDPSFHHWNGYVGVPEGHAWFGKGYSESLCGHAGCYDHTLEMEIEVHGGVTFSGHLLQQDPQGKFWWFGFDTGHSSDDPRYGGTAKSPYYVRHECYKLAQQLIARNHTLTGSKKVRVTLFYEDGIYQRTLKEGDPMRLPDYFISYKGPKGLPRAIMLCKDRKHTLPRDKP